MEDWFSAGVAELGNVSGGRARTRAHSDSESRKGQACMVRDRRFDGGWACHAEDWDPSTHWESVPHISSGLRNVIQAISGLLALGRRFRDIPRAGMRRTMLFLRKVCRELARRAGVGHRFSISLSCSRVDNANVSTSE